MTYQSSHSSWAHGRQRGLVKLGLKGLGESGEPVVHLLDGVHGLHGHGDHIGLAVQLLHAGNLVAGLDVELSIQRGKPGLERFGGVLNAKGGEKVLRLGVQLAPMDGQRLFLGVSAVLQVFVVQDTVVGVVQQVWS